MKPRTSQRRAANGKGAAAAPLAARPSESRKASLRIDLPRGELDRFKSALAQFNSRIKDADDKIKFQSWAIDALAVAATQLVRTDPWPRLLNSAQRARAVIRLLSEDYILRHRAHGRARPAAQDEEAADGMGLVVDQVCDDLTTAVEDVANYMQSSSLRARPISIPPLPRRPGQLGRRFRFPERGGGRRCCKSLEAHGESGGSGARARLPHPISPHVSIPGASPKPLISHPGAKFPAPKAPNP